MRRAPGAIVEDMRVSVAMLLVIVATPTVFVGACTSSPDSPDSADADAETNGCVTDSQDCRVNGPLSCCNGACVNEQNDPFNCGACGVRCSEPSSMCLNGHCSAPTCQPACAAGTQCCLVNSAGPAEPPSCRPGTGCPVGCPACT